MLVVGYESDFGHHLFDCVVVVFVDVSVALVQCGVWCASNSRGLAPFRNANSRNYDLEHPCIEIIVFGGAVVCFSLVFLAAPRCFHAWRSHREGLPRM